MRAILVIVVLALATALLGAEMPCSKEFTNSMGISDDFGKSYKMSACQGTNGIIHVVSSWNEYAFNLKWLETPPPAKPVN